MHIAVPGVVRYAYEGHEVVLDTIAAPGSKNQTPRPLTRFRTLFESKEGFRFKIYPENGDVFEKGLKFFGLMKDVEIGQPEFDAQFIMRGTDDQRIKQFFSDPTLQQLLEPMPPFSVLQVLDNDPNFFKKRLPKGVDILTWSFRGVADNLEMLRSMRALFHYTLARMIELDIAAATPPDVEITD